MNAFPPWPNATKDNPLLALRAGQADCWALPQGAAPTGGQDALLRLLSADEAARAARFRFERDRTHYIRRHASLRIVVARYLGVAPASLVFAAETNGRPVLTQPLAGLHFNLSHSGDLALLAVGPVATIGADLEEIEAIPDFLQVAQHHFATAEFENLGRLPAEKQLAGFYATWTRKEAFVKALGIGLSYPLDAFTTGRTDQAPMLSVNDKPRQDWTMTDLSPGAGYAAALAVGQPGVSVRCFKADWAWLLEDGVALE